MVRSTSPWCQGILGAHRGPAWDGSIIRASWRTPRARSTRPILLYAGHAHVRRGSAVVADGRASGWTGRTSPIHMPRRHAGRFPSLRARSRTVVHPSAHRGRHTGSERSVAIGGTPLPRRHRCWPGSQRRQSRAWSPSARNRDRVPGAAAMRRKARPGGGWAPVMPGGRASTCTPVCSYPPATGTGWSACVATPCGHR